MALVMRCASATFGSGDGFGVHADVEATLVKNTGGGFVGEDEDGLYRGAADLQPEAGFARVEEAGIAPRAVGATGEDDTIAVLQSEQKTGFELVGDNDRLGGPEHFLRNGVFRVLHELADDRFAGFEPLDVVFTGETTLGVNGGGGG